MKMLLSRSSQESLPPLLSSAMNKPQEFHSSGVSKFLSDLFERDETLTCFLVGHRKLLFKQHLLPNCLHDLPRRGKVTHLTLREVNQLALCNKSLRNIIMKRKELARDESICRPLLYKERSSKPFNNETVKGR